MTAVSRRPLPYAALQAADAISRLGDVMTAVVIPWFVLETTGSAGRTGIVVFAGAVAVVISLFLGGTVVDRLGFRRISLAGDLASGATVALIALFHHFDALPFEPHQFDVVVFTCSLHYSSDPESSLREAVRMVSPGGTVAVMDSPVFRRDADGERMIADQRRRLQVEDGLVAPIRSGVGFLTYTRMERAFRSLGLRCRFLRSRGPLVWRLRRQIGRWRLGRQPAAFGVWVAQ